MQLCSGSYSYTQQERTACCTQWLDGLASVSRPRSVWTELAGLPEAPAKLFLARRWPPTKDLELTLCGLLLPYNANTTNELLDSARVFALSISTPWFIRGDESRSWYRAQRDSCGWKAECSPQISGSGKYYYHYFCYSYIMSKVHHRTTSSLCSLPVEKDKIRYSIPSGQGPKLISRRSHPYPGVHHSTDFVLPYAASISFWYIFTIILRFNFCAGVSNPYISSASFSLLKTSLPKNIKRTYILRRPLRIR
jgi:hypothetical protein